MLVVMNVPIVELGNRLNIDQVQKQQSMNGANTFKIETTELEKK